MHTPSLNLKTALLFFFFFFFALGFLVEAQERSCGMVEYMIEQMKDPEYAEQYKKSQIKFKAQLEKNLSNKQLNRSLVPIVIPVAVHFPSGLESDRACLEALAQNQIDILNEDFTGTNPDISNWTAAASYYPSVNTGATNFEFRIATTNHPTGIDPEMVEGGPAVTIGYNFGGGDETDSNWGGYMNFLIKDIGSSTLGFSPFPGSVAAGDSVTMNLSAFGSGAGCPNSGIVPRAPYDLGRTVTHELGHFYNLNHTFTNSCNTDDGIDDTPNQSLSNGGCPALGSQPACDPSEQELFQSYMDYTYDACMFMFSEGQTTVAEAYVMSIASTFKNGTLSVDQFSLGNALNIWPNPSNGILNLSLSTKNSADVHVALYDLSGRLILEKTFNNNGGVFKETLQLDHLESALYILSIENAGKKLNTRIVIE